MTNYCIKFFSQYCDKDTVKKEKTTDGEKSVLVRISKMRKFEEIMNLGQISASALGLRMFQKEIERTSKKILHCEKAHLYYYDTKEDVLVRDIWTKNGQEHKFIRYNIDKTTFVGTCAYEHNMLNLVDIYNDIRSKKMDESLDKMNCHSLLLSPLMLEGENIGVIKAINSNKRRFNDEDEFFMSAISNQTSIVLNNFNLVEKLRKQFFQIVKAMSDIIIKRDAYTGGHTKRVEHFSEMIAREMDLSHTDIMDLRLAAILHDIGKVGIEDKILKKKAPLTKEEFEIMKQHPKIGFEILGHIDGLEKVVDGMRFHHERPDGKGYPYGLSGKEIPLIASIVSVADAFDAMISKRPYSQGRSTMEAFYEIIEHRGRQFDPDVVDAFVRGFKKTKMYKIKEVKEKKVA